MAYINGFKDLVKLTFLVTLSPANFFGKCE